MYTQTHVGHAKRNNWACYHRDWRTHKTWQANTYTRHQACSTLRIKVVISKNDIYGDENQDVNIFIWLMMGRGGGGGGGRGRGGREGDGRPLVSWLGRIQAVWNRSDLTQPSFSRTGHVRLDLSHTTDIIPLSGGRPQHTITLLQTEERRREGREGGDGGGEGKQKINKEVS